jgi:ankyrin repeat protein
MALSNLWDDDELVEIAEFNRVRPNPLLNNNEVVVMETISSGRIDKLAELLENGKAGHFRGIYIDCNTQQTPLQACMCENIRYSQGLDYTIHAMKLLIDYGADVNYSGVLKADTVLSDAVIRNDVGVVKFLLENGADVHKKYGTPLNKSGIPDRTVLFHCKSFRIATLLIQHGADVNANESYGFTPLHYMAKKVEDGVRFGEVMDVLLGNGANIEACTNVRRHGPYGSTPLLISIMNGNFEVADALIRRGANMETQNLANGYTPLHVAAKYGMVPYVRLLFQQGARGDSIDKYGNKAIDICKTGDALKLFHIELENRRKLYNPCRHEAIHMGLHERLGACSPFSNKFPPELLGMIMEYDTTGDMDIQRHREWIDMELVSSKRRMD